MKKTWEPVILDIIFFDEEDNIITNSKDPWGNDNYEVDDNNQSFEGWDFL